MANNGGTLNGVPQPDQGLSLNNSCNPCGLSFDSSDSLNVHVHYHHSNGDNTINHWPNSNNSTNSPIHANSSPTDLENNNQPKLQVKSAVPDNYTISAAADSSDNQPATPQSVGSGDNIPLRSQHDRHASFGAGLASHYPHQSLDMHYPSYMSNYDQYYHQHSMEYGMGPPSHYFGNPIQQPEYKTAPSGRFHPYGGGLPAYSHGHQQPNPNGLAHAAAAAAITAAASQSSISPTSSSPTHINSMHTTTAPPSMSGTTTTTTATTPIGQPTPSPSPRHCDKCGYVCESLARLNEHMVNAHDAPANVTDPTSGSGNGDIENHIPSFQYANFGQVKSETVAPNDILDLDSQKMVYPPHEANQQNAHCHRCIRCIRCHDHT